MYCQGEHVHNAFVRIYNSMVHFGIGYDSIVQLCAAIKRKQMQLYNE
jgi:hypothetical protein